MTTALLPVPIFRAFDTAGLPLAGGLLYSYAAGTLTPQNTYSDAAGSTPNTNPVVLDSTGSATVRLDPTLSYKFVLNDSLGTLQWSEDNYQTSYLTATAIGLILWPQTSSEIAAGVTPTNFGYPPYWVPRYMSASQLADWLSGAAAVSQLTAFTACYNVAMAAIPHGYVYAPAGTYLIPSPGLTWTNQNDIRFYGDGPNSTVLQWSGSNYTVLTISADTGAGTTGTNLSLENFGVGPLGGVGVNAISLADYSFHYLKNLQLYCSGNALALAGMANGVYDNINANTAGTNAAGNSALLMTTDTDGIGCGALVFNGGFLEGRNNVTDGGAIFSKRTIPAVFNGTQIVALGSALVSAVAITSGDDVTFNECYSESTRNTSADTAVMFALGATAAPQNFILNGGTYFLSASGHSCAYGINATAIQAMSVNGTTFANQVTAAIKYVTTIQSMISLRNVYSTGSANPPVLDSSIAAAPVGGYLKSWGDPYPRLDASLVSGVASVTGDGTVYTILFDTKNFDTTSSYATGTGVFTVPLSCGGMYDVSASVVVNGLSASYTGAEMDIVQKNSGGSTVTTHAVLTNPGAVRNAANQSALTQSCLLSCTQGDKISVTIAVTGSTKSVGVAGAATEYTRLCIRYLG